MSNLEIRVFVNERLGKDAKVRLDALGYRWEAGCWKCNYNTQVFNEAIWVLQKSGFLAEDEFKDKFILGLWQKTPQS